MVDRNRDLTREQKAADSEIERKAQGGEQGHRTRTVTER